MHGIWQPFCSVSLRLRVPPALLYATSTFKPSGPPAEPLGKDSMADLTSVSVRASMGLELSGGCGGFELGWADGCFFLRVAKVLSSIKDSSEHA